MPAADASTLVACLCAQWCGTCRDYRATFDEAAASFTAVRFLWVDIEDQAELVDAVDVEDFPTLLIVQRQEPVFFGPLTPQPQTLARLIRRHLDEADAQPLRDAKLRAVAERLLVAAAASAEPRAVQDPGPAGVG